VRSIFAQKNVTAHIATAQYPKTIYQFCNPEQVAHVVIGKIRAPALAEPCVRRAVFFTA
jgi:hypothetical protein